MESKRLKIIECKVLEEYKIWIRFNDGSEGIVDLSALVGKGVFQAWESLEFFNQVSIDKITGTLTWNAEIDLDPYVLKEKLANS